MDNVQTANTIKDLCRARNITINTLLTDCNIRKGLIYDMEKRDKTPSPEILERIADHLNCSVDYLLGRGKGFLPERLQEALGGMTCEEFAQRFDYKPKIISDYLEGKRKPLNATLFQMATDLCVNPEWLYGFDAPKYKKPTPEDGGGLSEKDVRLIAWFRSLPPEKRKAILMLGEAPEGLDE